MFRQIYLGTAAALGGGSLANGCYMLIAPQRWYVAVPGVTTTGPFNQHFLRGIGVVFLFTGAAFLVGAARPVHRLALWGTASLALFGYALFHLSEVAAGMCGPSAILWAFPAVTLPAATGAVLALSATRTNVQGWGQPAKGPGR